VSDSLSGSPTPWPLLASLRRDREGAGRGVKLGADQLRRKGPRLRQLAHLAQRPRGATSTSSSPATPPPEGAGAELLDRVLFLDFPRPPKESRHLGHRLRRAKASTPGRSDPPTPGGPAPRSSRAAGSQPCSTCHGSRPLRPSPTLPPRGRDRRGTRSRACGSGPRATASRRTELDHASRGRPNLGKRFTKCAWAASLAPGIPRENRSVPNGLWRLTRMLCLYHGSEKHLPISPTRVSEACRNRCLSAHGLP
jgi:hypothetical protein